MRSARSPLAPPRSTEDQHWEDHGSGERAADPPEVRRLAAQLVEAACRGTPRSAADQVLLDLEFEDVRCLVTRRQPDAGERLVALSPREREVARMVARGYPNKTIAGVLEISTWTVSTHLRRIFAKLGVGSRAAMVALVAELGYLGERGERTGAARPGRSPRA